MYKKFYFPAMRQLLTSNKQKIITHLFIIIFLHFSLKILFIESDNPGSTDSEVRKILTLHIPITEYDTLGSESDNEITSRAVNNQTAAKYRTQRG